MNKKLKIEQIFQIKRLKTNPINAMFPPLAFWCLIENHKTVQLAKKEIIKIK